MKVYSLTDPTKLIYESSEEQDELDYPGEKERLLDPTIKTWKINIKGYHNQSFTDPTIRKKYVDVVYGYGFVLFTGTYKECGEYEMVLFRSGNKILGSSEYSLPPDQSDLKKRVFELVGKASKKLQDLMDYNERYNDHKLNWSDNRLGRNYTKEELKLKAVYDRIFRYYVRKFC